MHQQRILNGFTHYHRFTQMPRLFLAFIFTPTLLIALAFTLTTCKKGPATASPHTRPHLTPAEVDTNHTRIVIEKSAYQLKLYEKDRLLCTYPIVLGFDPIHDKCMEGDGRTPEGLFHVRTKYDHKSWSKFIWVDYPTTESYTRFNRRKQNGEIPATATIGGEIGIHGTPEGREDLITDKKNWTLGCISLSREDVDELYSLIKTQGTEILILH
jgi:murein L,D-transpeptidase YafK